VQAEVATRIVIEFGDGAVEPVGQADTASADPTLC
jgi:hypothetical protein